MMKNPRRKLGLFSGLSPRIVVFFCAAIVGLLGCGSAPVSQSSSEVRVRFELDMRAEIAAGRFAPASDQVGVRAGSAPLSWAYTALAQARGDGRYEVEVRFPARADLPATVQYKFKIDRQGFGPNEGWEEDRNRQVRLNASEITVARAFNAPPEPIVPIRTGTIERIAPMASQFGPARDVQVWLPPGYAGSAARYPVLYLHDGQVVFDAQSAGAEWHADETAQQLVESGAIAPIIIVAVANAGSARMLEYTPTQTYLSAERLGQDAGQTVGGGAPRYARYLVEELKPMIDARYRTLTGPEHTAVGGSSLGGLVSAWLVLQRPDIFGAALVVSPSVWWDDAFITRHVLATPTPSPRHPKIWLDMGGQEGAQALPAARALRDAFLQRGWTQSNLRFTEYPDGAHDEASWAARFPAMLRYLYGNARANK